MREKRMDTRPYYRETETKGWFSLMGISFIVGCMCGATIALGLLA